MRHFLNMVGLVMALGAIGLPSASAQVRTIDPNRPVDSDLSSRAPPQSTPQSAPPSEREPLPETAADEERFGDKVSAEPQDAPPAEPRTAETRSTDAGARAATTAAASPTYKRGDIFSAGERVFGRGAEGLGGILEKILKEQGEPNAYIAGREASGAVVVGLRYGSGVMSHRIEGDRPVYWTGPSVGFDLGGNASKVFVLVYNLYDTEDIFHRFPEGEGHLYLVGGFSATYLRRGNIVLIPVRLGVGVRAGVNIGYMKFRKKQNWLPF